MDSGTVAKPSAGLPLGSRIEALMHALSTRRHAAALEHVVHLLGLEPDEPRWHQKHGDILRQLDRELEAAAAYRNAAQCYEIQGLAAHASALYRVADTLEGRAPAAGVVRLSDLRPRCE